MQLPYLCMHITQISRGKRLGNRRNAKSIGSRYRVHGKAVSDRQCSTYASSFGWGEYSGSKGLTNARVSMH